MPIIQSIKDIESMDVLSGLNYKIEERFGPDMKLPSDELYDPEVLQNIDVGTEELKLAKVNKYVTNLDIQKALAEVLKGIKDDLTQYPVRINTFEKEKNVKDDPFNKKLASCGYFYNQYQDRIQHY